MLLVYTYSKLRHAQGLQAELAGPTEPLSQRDEGQTSGNPPEAAGPMTGKPKNLSCVRLSRYGTPNYPMPTWIKSFQIHGAPFRGLRVQRKAFSPLQQVHRSPADRTSAPVQRGRRVLQTSTGLTRRSSPANPRHVAALTTLQKQSPNFQDVPERTSSKDRLFCKRVYALKHQESNILASSEIVLISSHVSCVFLHRVVVARCFN